MSNKSFVFYDSFFNAISLIPKEHRLECYEAICNYALNGVFPKDQDGYAKVILTMAKPNIDSNMKKRKGGSKGGRPKEETYGYEDEKPMVIESENHRLSDGETYGYEGEKPNVNVNVNEDVNGNVNADVNADVNVDVNVDVNEDANGDNTPPIPPPGKPTRETQEQIFDRLIVDQNIGLEMEKVLREWLKYKSERKETYKPTGMKNMITQVQNSVYQFGELAVMDRIKHAMANGWKGMNLDKMESNKASPQRRMDEVNDMISRWRVASEELERRRNDSG